MKKWCAAFIALLCLAGCHSDSSLIIVPPKSVSIATADASADSQNEETDTLQTDSFTKKADIPQNNFFNEETDTLHKTDGNTQYLSRREGNDCVLYSFDTKTSHVKRLAVFPPTHEDSPYTNNYIIQLDICGDWLILSVGHYEGSAHIFYGDFARLKKDGSKLEHFSVTDTDYFFIVGDWIYYNFWEVEHDPEAAYGCYRIRPDGSGKEFLSEGFSMQRYADGYIYGTYDTGKTVPDTGKYWYRIHNLVRCKPDATDFVTLFSGQALPTFDDAGSMAVYVTAVAGTLVTFNVNVRGYADGDSWRGHTCYWAEYKVNTDGSNLTLLKEEYLEHTEW